MGFARVSGIAHAADPLPFLHFFSFFHGNAVPLEVGQEDLRIISVTGEDDMIAFRVFRVHFRRG